MAKDSANKSVISAISLYIALLFVCSGCERTKEAEEQRREFEIDQVQQRGPLTVHVRVDKDKLTIAETLLLELEATVEPQYEVQMPKVNEVLKNFGIVDWENPGDRLDEDNNLAKTRRYRLEPFLSGNYEIPAFTFEFHDVNDVNDTYELATEPIEVEVASLLGQQRAVLDANAIEDIEEIIEMPQEASLLWVWVLAGTAVVSATGGWLYLRRKRAEELIRIFKPAHEVAYERLRILLKDDLIKAGRIKEFYERISNILRHYIEHRFDLRAPERTTEEFLVEIQFTNALSEPDKESLSEFLKHCDLVKFAKYSPTTEQIQRTFDLVKEFIEKTRSDERKIDVTDKERSEEPVGAGSL